MSTAYEDRPNRRGRRRDEAYRGEQGVVSEEQSRAIGCLNEDKEWVPDEKRTEEMEKLLHHFPVFVYTKAVDGGRHRAVIGPRCVTLYFVNNYMMQDVQSFMLETEEQGFKDALKCPKRRN